MPPSLREAHRAGLARYLRTGTGSYLDNRIEITGLRANGEEFPVELTITEIDRPGAAVFAGFIRDITDRKQAEEEIRASRARLVGPPTPSVSASNATSTTARSSTSSRSRSSFGWRRRNAEELATRAKADERELRRSPGRAR